MPEEGAERAGTLIVVTGPSGAGKDSVIGFAADRLSARADIHFVRRVITRPRDAGGEPHEAVTLKEFEARREAGAFAVTWGAHGLRYGIPAVTAERVRAGQTVIANGSRAALPLFRDRFPRVVTVQITASRAVLARRLMARGRESEEDILRRLDRQAPVDDPAAVVIDNSGPLPLAAGRFVALVEAISAGRHQPATA
ncbi:phosphonate metabolism protein/1,5-bisphosphokinase (PRPP-forming) PhnN [Ensifer soli]|uniref:phosphonate metabolism protein/1,5-bisphosphokinase (PRPP-forming) PhnN n=1 Tax=Ciceribacter sp. sgz301302 TaxID=3342379 RepID=UPI0035BB1519